MTPKPPGRAPALAALAALMLAASSCGNNDNDNDGDARKPPVESAAAETIPATGTPREQIAATLETMHKAFKDKDAATVCAALTAAAQRRTAKAAGKPQDSCENIMAVHVDRYADKIVRGPELESVRVNGNKAIARIRTGDTTVRPTVFINTPNGWKSNQAIEF